MSITCQLCQTSFPKIIPYQHLQKKHQITSAEYKSQFGSLWSPAVIANAKKRTPHNKGKKITDPSDLKKIWDKIAKREARYAKGELIRPRLGQHWDSDHKKLLSEKSISYAKNNTEEIKERAQKAQATKRKNGPIVGPMTNRKHSEKTKITLKEIAHNRSKIQQEETWKKYLKLIDTLPVTLLETYNNNWLLKFQCNTCNSIFNRTRQILYTSKIPAVICHACRGTPSQSKAEIEIASFILSQGISVETGNRTLISPLEIDIYIPSHSLAIEYCGVYWHSELYGGKDSKYHKFKYDEMEKQGIKLLTIFSDEWNNHKDLIKSKLLSMLQQAPNKIYARRCQIKEIAVKEAREFLNQNHLSGYGNSTVKLGLYHNDILVYVSTFAKSNISRKNINWEIQRMASLQNTIVVGAASKLFSYFVKKYQPKTVITYSDLRWGKGAVYKSLGFTPEGNTVPGYWYFLLPNETRIHRFTLRKTRFDDKDKTEWNNRQEQGYDRIWDCGHAKWIWKTTGL